MGQTSKFTLPLNQTIALKVWLALPSMHFSIRVFITIITVSPPHLGMQNHWIPRADCTTSLYTRDLSIHDFGICRGSWTQCPLDTEGRLYSSFTALSIELPLSIVGGGLDKAGEIKIILLLLI